MNSVKIEPVQNAHISEVVLDAAIELIVNHNGITDLELVVSKDALVLIHTNTYFTPKGFLGEKTELGSEYFGYFHFLPVKLDGKLTDYDGFIKGNFTEG